MGTINQDPTRAQIYQRLDAKDTNELLALWRKINQEGWRGTAYDILGEILRKRLGAIPPYQPYQSYAPISPPTARSSKMLWVMLSVIAGMAFILAAIMFSSRPSKQAVVFTPTAPPTKTRVPTARPTRTPAPTVTPTVPSNVFRPPTGIVMPNQNSGGYGELTVENGTAQDGVVILTLNDEPVVSFYIRSGDSYTLKGIRDGVYYIYFSTGTDWNGQAFLTNPSYKKFEDAFEFKTGATTYTIWSVTLHGVVGGTAGAENVAPSEFPAVGN